MRFGDLPAYRVCCVIDLAEACLNYRTLCTCCTLFYSPSRADHLVNLRLNCLRCNYGDMDGLHDAHQSRPARQPVTSYSPVFCDKTQNF